MGGDERCSEYLVWQCFFGCAECQYAEDTIGRSVVKQTIISNTAAGAKSIAVGEVRQEMEQTTG